MKIDLSAQQKEDRAAFRAFTDEEIVPYANEYDRQERFPPELIKKLGQRGYLGYLIPKEYGGAGKDLITYGLLNEEIGRGCSSTRSLLTVHGMASRAVVKWGTKQQKQDLLPRLASGEVIGAFGMTEPAAGSDVEAVETTARFCCDHYVLNGVKKWVSFGQVADLFLIFGRCEGKHTAFLVERTSPGFSMKPVSGMLGVRASMLAELRMEECRIPKENVVGKIGFGLPIASSALHYGRYSVAWGCVGIAQACLNACVEYSNRRKQFGKYLKDHQLIQKMISDMVTNLRAARLLCFQAGYCTEIKDAEAVMATLIAKYFASTTATKAATDAVQIHGANGCSGRFPVERYMRDARIMEIIEGSTQIQQITIAKYKAHTF